MNFNNIKKFWTEKEKTTKKSPVIVLQGKKIRSDQLALPRGFATPKFSHGLSENES